MTENFSSYFLGTQRVLVRKNEKYDLYFAVIKGLLKRNKTVGTKIGNVIILKNRYTNFEIELI